jgi:hypothetical protein
MLSFLMTAATNTAAVMNVISTALIIISGFAVWSLIRLWISGAVIHQSVKPKEFSQSWSVAKSRYFSLLAVTIIVGLIATVVSIVPYIGWVLSIIVGLMFFFIRPAVVAKKLSFDNSLRDSYHIFRKKPLTVLLIWLAITIISVIMLFIFFMPLLMTVLNTIAPLLFQMSSTAVVSLVMVSLMENIGLLVLGGEVFLIGNAITEAFRLKAETDFYLMFKKGKKVF